MTLGLRGLAVLVAATAAMVPAPVARAAGAQRVVEGESLRGVGSVVVRKAGATRGRVLRIAPGGTASRAVETADVGLVKVRGMRRGCGRSVRVGIDGGRALLVRLSRHKLASRRLKVSLPAGRHVFRVTTPGRIRRTRCAAMLDRLRLVPAAPGEAPVAQVAPAPAPPPASPSARVPLGSSLQLDYLQKDPTYRAAFLGAFSSLSPENELKMDWVHPAKDTWNFAAADSLADFALANRITMRGHTLIFGAQTPPWVARELLPGQIRDALDTEIRTVIARYKDRIHEWDVVNEALDDNGKYRANVFYNALGVLYVDRAFEIARATDPTAKLYYNEFNADVNNFKRAAVVDLVKRLKSKGLIDGVGMQLHTAIGHAPSQEALEETMRLYEGLGLEVQVTEMDVDAVSDRGDEPLTTRFEQQAEAFGAAARACAAVAACKRFTVWGVSDKYSWLGADHIPLLMDDAFQPKPALGTVRQALGL